MNSLPVAQSFPLGTPERDAIIQAFTSVFRTILWISIIPTAFAFLLTLTMKNVKMKDDRNEETEVSG